MSLATLAQASTVAKSTLSDIERGLGNPSLETLWSIVQALNIPFAALFEHDETANAVRIVRKLDAPIIASDPGVFVSRLMLSRHASVTYELYAIELAEHSARRATRGHTPGVIEHVFVAQGRAAVGPEGATVDLDEGDCVTFAADREHRYEAIDGTARIVIVQEYPTGTSAEIDPDGAGRR